MADTYFEVLSVLGKRVRVSESYWKFIITMKHPAILGKEELVKGAVSESDEVRRSRKDRSVYLYYKRFKKNFIGVVCKHLNGEGYIITAYITDRIKIGEIIWQKQK